MKQLIVSLKSRGFKSYYVENKNAAKDKILDLIPKNATVGIGDSTAVRQIGVIEEAKKRGIQVFDAFSRKLTSQDIRKKMVRESAFCDVFLTGTNAVTLDGRLVNLDASGNRVAGMFYGHPLSIIVIGKNKIVNSLDDAFNRIRNIIAPNHLKIRSTELGGIPFKTPCMSTGLCSDCRSKDRICNIFTIIEGNPSSCSINVVIVNEDLGLAWNKSWSEKRISKIKEEYKKFVWIPHLISRVHI